MIHPAVTAPPPRRHRYRLLALAGLALALFTLPGGAAERPAAAPIAITAVTVTPAAPAADTLCQLRVELDNHGDRVISQLAFTVKVNGQELPVYRRQLFMQRVDPGRRTQLRLYNFWSSETGRPAPADGKYKVEVSLVEAQWFRIGMEDGVEVWTPLGPVPGLPVNGVATAGK
ncbi:MAG TPA: hypothetical protein VGV61_03470 [Thermoanaerobaculia bacterium]|nr:hypothetical protein [Thermoanaerobaculia bacterium]